MKECPLLHATSEIVTACVIGVDFSGNPVGTEGTKSIAACLKENKSILYLKLSENFINPDGAHFLAQSLAVNKTLKSLDLSCNHLLPQGTREISVALASNTSVSTVSLANNEIGSMGAMWISECIRGNSTITDLDVSGNHFGSQGVTDLCEGLKVNSSIRRLNLARNEIGVEGASLISDLLQRAGHIHEIDLSGNNLGSEGICHIFQARSFSAVSSIDISQNDIGTEGVRALSSYLKAGSLVNSLNMSGNELNVDSLGLITECLKEESSITSINLAKCNISTGFPLIADALKVNTSLRSLNLSANRIGAEGALVLSGCLQFNSTLTSLNIAESQLAAKGTLFFSHYLRKNSSLLYLDLTDNGIDDDAAPFLADALKVNSTLSSLDLSGNILKIEGARTLSIALKENRGVTYLSLKRNKIGPLGAQCISECLKVNNSLETLILAGNKINSAGTLSLCEGLSLNTSLTFLDLTRNGIGDEGLVAFSTYVKSTKSLVSFNLSGNGLNYKAIHEISSALQCNQSIVSTTFSETHFPREAIIFMINTLHMNKLLSKIDLSWNEFGSEETGTIFSALSQSPGIPIALTTFTNKFDTLGNIVHSLEESKFVTLAPGVCHLFITIACQYLRVSSKNNSTAAAHFLCEGILMAVEARHLDLAFHTFRHCFIGQIENGEPISSSVAAMLEPIILEASQFPENQPDVILSILFNTLDLSVKRIKGTFFQQLIVTLSKASLFIAVQALLRCLLRINHHDIPELLCLVAMKNIFTGRNLDLSRLQLSRIPEELCQLECSCLDLRFNFLEELPQALSNINDVLLEGNPLTKILDTIQHLPWSEFRLYVKYNELPIHWKYRKVLVVGEPEAGKTTLLECLESKKSTVDVSKSRMATDGVAMHRPFSLRKKSQLKWTAWDLGGQDVLHSSHQFFLCSNSIFMIVFDIAKAGRDDATFSVSYQTIKYWISTIMVLKPSQEPPTIILIGTHYDLCLHVEAVVQALLSQFNRQTFHSIFVVSLKTGKGLFYKNREWHLSRKKTVSDLIAELEVVGTSNSFGSVPLSWAKLADSLEEARVRTKIMQQREYLEMSSSSGVSPEHLPLCTRFLCDSGVILFFGEVNTLKEKAIHFASLPSTTPTETSRVDLHELFVLDPSWLSTVLQTLITISNRDKFVREGMLNASDIPHVLAGFAREMHAAILELLQRFEIAHVLEDNRILVPCLLPLAPQPMAFALQPGKPALEHGRRYQFAFLPVGFFSRLMARMLSIPSVNIVSISKFRLVISQQTKDGIIQEAFATYEEKASRLDFRVKIFEGVDHSHPLLANNLLLLILLDIVAALLKTFYHRQMGDQQVTQFVPCVHCLMTSPQTPENEVYYFPLDDCILSMKSGTHVMYCRQLALPSKCIRVLHLAPDIAMVGLTSIPANEISFGHTKSHSDSPHTESSPSISEHDNVGVGVSGSVRMGILNNIPVAVKEPHSYNSSSLGEFLYEAHIMTTIPPHPNIVRFFGVCSVPPCILLIMEFIFPATLSPSMWGHFDGNLKSSDLDHFLQAVWGSQKRNTDTDVVSLLLPCELRQRILYDVAAGMNHLHSLVPPLLHRDLHAGNIMICSLDWKAPSPVAKVTDFGLSERLFVAKTAGMQERLEVFPPELHAGKPYGLPADVWSFGTACFLLFSPPLATPYDFLLANPKFATIPRGTELASLKRSEVRQGLISGEVLPRPPEQCPNWASQLMSICWSHEPEQRPTFSWLTSNDSSPLLAGLKEACPFLGSTHNGPYFAEYSNSMPETIPSSPKPLYFVSGENNLNRASAYRCTQQANLRAVGGDSLVIVNCRKIISCASQWWCGCNNGNIVVLQPESLPEVASSSTADTEFRIIRRRWRAHIGQQSEVTALLYLPQSECVLSGSSGGEVKFWNSITFEHQGSILASHEQASILVLAIAPQTQQIWVGDSRGVASVWNLSETSLGMSMSMVWSTRISHNFHHHSSPLSPHSSSSITPASSSAVFSKTLPFHRSRYSPIVDISPLHDRVVIATAEVITVYTMDKFSPMAHLEGTDLAHQSLTCLTCVSSNGPAASQQSIWAGTSRGVIIAWDGNFNMKNSVQVHDRTVNGIITDPTFNLVWSCSFDGKAVAFDYTTFAPIHEVVVSKEEVHAIAVTQYCFPEQRISSKSWLATISHDDLVKFWQRTDNQSRFPSTPDKQLAASVFRRAVRSRVFQHNRRKFQADPNELLLLLRLQGNPLVYGQDFEFVGRIENTYDSPLFLASFTFPSDTNSPEERQVMFSIAVVPEDHLFSAHDLDVIEKKLFRVVERAKNENDVLHNIDRHPSIFPLFTSFFVKLPASIFHDSESLYRKQAAQGLHFHLCVYPSYDCTLATVISACTKTKAGLPFSSGCAVVPAVSVNLVNRIVSSLVSALNHMQTHFLVHADIQPSNVLLSENGTRVLLTGFGHSRFMRGNGTTVGPWCGSAFWCPQNSIIPPEVKEQLRTLTDPHRSLVNFSKADEFSVGVTVLHLMTAMVLPPQESEEVMQSATGSYNFDTIGNKLLPAQIFSRDLTEIVLLMASINPMERPHISSSLIDIVEGLT